MRLGGDSFFLLSLLCSGAVAPFAPDLIRPGSLPNVDFQVRFNQYSGYLQASSTHFFHYWLTESQGNPSRDPLILWLSGGPGCSSVSGLLSELGPFRPQANGARVDENPYTWSKLGNVLYIESPAGVGFSYATDGNLITNDDETAKDNYGALIAFLNKFQEYRGRDFYITGESYAGVYLPTLAALLVKDPTNFPNFKGMAIGNGLLNYPMLVNDLIPMLYYHGLVSETQWTGLSKCCNGKPANCNFYQFIMPNMTNTTCGQLTTAAYGSPYNMDPYNLYYHCYTPGHNMSNPGPPPFADSLSRRDVYQRAMRKHLNLPIPPPSSEAATPPLPQCALYKDDTVWMNLPATRKALHIPDTIPNITSWSSCSDYVNRHYQYQYNDLSPQVKMVLAAGVRVLIYNGDVDTVCNFKGDERFAASLGRTLIADKAPWRYDYSAPANAGFVTRYKGLDFVTVRGSGHFVPATRPREALQMLSTFIRGGSLGYSTFTTANTAAAPLTDACSQPVTSRAFPNAPLKRSNLCMNGAACVTSAGGAVCVCPPGFTGAFCGTPFVSGRPSARVSLCAAYATAMTRAASLPVGCPSLYACLPLSAICAAKANCNYPVGYCVPSGAIPSSSPLNSKTRAAMTKALLRQARTL